MKKPKTWKNNDIIYQLVVADIQDVAEQGLERKLSSQEIDHIIDRIAKAIPWYDAIASSIDEMIVENSK